MKLCKISLLVLFGAVLGFGQSIPPIKAKALDDSQVTLPNPGSGQALILVVGFSRKSGDVARGWSTKISADYHNDARVAYFTIPVLEGAPSLVRPMVVRGMRKDVPAQERPHFVPLHSGESEWKKTVNFSAPDDAYLIVATPDGHPVWQAHGAYSDAVYADLKKSVTSVCEKASR